MSLTKVLMSFSERGGVLNLVNRLATNQQVTLGFPC
jgi:hypothetical protein